MVSGVIEKMEQKYIPHRHSNHNATKNLTDFNHTSDIYLLDPDPQKAKLMIMIASTFCVGLFQMVLFIFHLGVLTFFLSETLIKGFILGCSIHVSVSQLKHILGLEIPTRHGLFEIPYVNNKY